MICGSWSCLIFIFYAIIVHMDISWILKIQRFSWHNFSMVFSPVVGGCHIFALVPCWAWLRGQTFVILSQVYNMRGETWIVCIKATSLIIFPNFIHEIPRLVVGVIVWLGNFIKHLVFSDLKVLPLNAGFKLWQCKVNEHNYNKWQLLLTKICTHSQIAEIENKSRTYPSQMWLCENSLELE